MGHYQYKREPLSADEANRLANACETHVERLVIWTFLDTGMRVSELAGLKRSLFCSRCGASRTAVGPTA